MEELKKASYVFWAGVLGVVVCLGGSIYTAVEQHQAVRAAESQVGRIPLPAIPDQNSGSISR